MKITKKIIMSIICSAAAAVSAAIPALNVNADEDSDGQIRQIPVYRKSLTEKETVDCMFFNDMPDIPYMAIDLYYKTFMDGEMTVEKQSDGKYLCTEKYFGQTALIDTKADTLTSDDMVLFISTPVHKLEEFGGVAGGPELITRTSAMSSDKTPDTVTVDYKKYNIDLREKDGVVYVPFASLSDLFSNIDVITTVYRDNKIFFLSYYYDINGGEAIHQQTFIPEFIKKGTRTGQEAEFAYNELCLCYDYFYGYPCLHNKFSDRMAEVGLDKALEELAPETQKLLKSESAGEYIAGLYCLTGRELADGGHSGLSDSYSPGEIPENVLSDLYSILSKTDFGDNIYIDKSNNIQRKYSMLFEVRSKAVGDEFYHRQGDTIMIRFDSFYMDYEGWQDYFSGKTDVMPDDTINTVYTNLEKAKADKSIKNVVFDLTTNTGGDTVVLDWICATIFGKTVYHEYIRIGDCTVTTELISDKNLDGKIDEQDSKINYDGLNFAVLTSGVSFSCGNLLPSMFRDNGCMVIGEQSSGGACCVLQKSTADGMLYRMSGYLRAQSKDGSSIDDGIPVDVSLVNGDDYSACYDLKKISTEMNAFYQEKTETSQQSLEESSESSADADEKSEASEQVSGYDVSSEASEQVSEPETSFFTSIVEKPVNSSDDLSVIVLWSVIGTLAVISLIAVLTAVLISRKKDQ